MDTPHDLKPERVIKSFWVLAVKILVDYFGEVVKLLYNMLIINVRVLMEIGYGNH